MSSSKPAILADDVLGPLLLEVSIECRVVVWGGVVWVLGGVLGPLLLEVSIQGLSEAP